jgi:hypothetical protein
MRRGWAEGAVESDIEAIERAMGLSGAVARRSQCERFALRCLRSGAVRNAYGTVQTELRLKRRFSRPRGGLRPCHIPNGDVALGSPWSAP